MRNTPLAWQLFNVAQTWGVRPSELAGVEDSYHAFCLDQAIAALGNGVRHRLDSLGTTDRKSKQLESKMQRELAVILGLPDQVHKRYRTPAVTRKE